MGRPCVVGCGAIAINERGKRCRGQDERARTSRSRKATGSRSTAPPVTFTWARPQTKDPDPNSPIFAKFMRMADEFRGDFGVRANADIPRDAKAARAFGAEGIGLCRTEHMFFAEDRLPLVQAMILARQRKGSPQGARQAAADAAQGFRRSVRSDGRLPGGHPHARSAAARVRSEARRADGGYRQAAARRHQDEEGDGGAYKNFGAEVKNLKTVLPELLKRVEELHEFNPMLGHRGCRLGITYPEITEMQARAIFEAAVAVAKKGKKVIPEVMIPLIGCVKELAESEGDR